HPVNRFVADFIGDTNFVLSDVAQGPDGLVVRIGGIGFPLPLDAAPAGGSATLAIRPENIALTQAEGAAVTGTLTELTYMGTDLRCQVRLDDAVSLRARVAPPFALGHLTPGGKVGVVIDPGDIKVVAD
ncbi:MAG: TOBE domain-containing protein, partial [Bifidobacteriaceae bacterium]|nr:TOBE domain-containing protein [Bifidobacteriaceae bacterium]